MRITGNGKLVELEEKETRPFEENEGRLRFAEPHPTRGTLAVYAWCFVGEPVFPDPHEKAEKAQ